MNKYTIYCTEEQTKKAFELGAPIEILPNYTEYIGLPLIKCKDDNERPYIPPTAEQMILWLEEQGIHDIRLVHLKDAWMFYIFLDGNMLPYEYNYPSRKEVTMAAIDAALEYLCQRNKIS